MFSIRAASAGRKAIIIQSIFKESRLSILKVWTSVIFIPFAVNLFAKSLTSNKYMDFYCYFFSLYSRSTIFSFLHKNQPLEKLFSWEHAVEKTLQYFQRRVLYSREAEEHQLIFNEFSYLQLFWIGLPPFILVTGQNESERQNTTEVVLFRQCTVSISADDISAN